PVETEQVASHQIVLLVHFTTSAHARQFFENREPDTVWPLDHPFSIVEFGESRQAEEFFFLRSLPGYLVEAGNGDRLSLGISVPVRVFVTEYSTTKLYDAEPPVAYLAELIWVHVVIPHARLRWAPRSMKIAVRWLVKGVRLSLVPRVRVTI
ncbi:MAG: hypothetical protein ACE5I2_16275, partial [Anaerolineae bacterium]